MIESIFEKKRPTWIDNQLNGKSAEENYQAFKKEQDEWLQSLYDKRNREREQKQLEKDIEEQAYKAVEKALEDLFKDFPTSL